MPDSSASPGILRFDAYEVNLRTGETRKHGIRIKLRGHPQEILAMLLDHPGEVVTREEIRRKLWPADTFVDFEHSVNTAVKTLRQALCDSAEEPQYIETLPKLGYRFIAAVNSGTKSVAVLERRPEAEDIAAITELSAAFVPQRRRSSLIWAVAFSVLAIAGITAYLVFTPLAEPKLIRFAKETVSDRADPWERLLTDGARVYFMERTGGHWSLMQTSAAGGEPQAFPAPFQYTRLFDISRDHSEFLIGGFESRVPNLPLWIWPVQGAPPVRVGEVNADDAAWYPDGQNILYVKGTEIRSVRRDGSGDHRLIQAPGTPVFPRFSPDGKRLSYTVHDLQTYARAIWEAAPDGGQAHLRFGSADDTHGECCGEWTADGHYFLFTSLSEGLGNLSAVREGGAGLHWGAKRPIALTASNDSIYGLLPVGNNGRAFAFADGGDIEALRYDMRKGRAVPLLSGTQILGAAISADGQWLAFQRMPDWSLWRARVDGSERLQLVSAPTRAAQPRWSPDGLSIAFEARNLNKPVRAYVVSAQGGRIEELLPRLEGAQGVPSWSPDGKSVAIAVNVDAARESKLPRGIFILNRESHEVTKLPESEGMTNPLWSPDGKYFTAKTPDERSILRYDWNSRKWTSIASDTQLGGLSWSSDSKYLYVQNIIQQGQPIYRLRAGDFRSELYLNLNSLLSEGIVRCALQTVAPDGSPVLALIRKGVHLYAVDLDLP